MVAVLCDALTPHDLALRAKAAVGEGADLVEVPADISDAAAAELTGAGQLWMVACANATQAAVRVAQGAAMVIVAPGADIGAASLAVPIVTDHPPVRAHDWRSIELAALASDPVSGASNDCVRLVTIPDAYDSAGVAAAATLALEFGADALRTTNPRAARRAAFVQRAIERTP